MHKGTVSYFTLALYNGNDRKTIETRLFPAAISFDTINCMENLELYAVEPERIVTLPVPPGARNFAQMMAGCELGVYSALRTFAHHKFLHLEDHLARTAQSLQLAGWEADFDQQRLRRALDAVCRAYGPANARVRFDILRRPPAHLGTESQVTIALMPLPEIPAALYEAGVRVDTAVGLRRERPLIKTAAFAAQREQFAREDQFYEYLLTDEAGFILEGTSSNFYGVIDGVLHTAGTGVLAGVTRKIILQQAEELGVPVSMNPVHQDGLTLLQEAAISSSSRALIPVVGIGEVVVGNGRPGPISRMLLAAYNRYVAGALRTAVAPPS
jgi:branched-chain amino acid aminotransferase